MKYFLNKALLVVSLFITSVSYAVPTWHTAKIKHIYPLSEGSVIIIFDTAHAACVTLDGAVRTYYYIRQGHNGVNEQGLKHIYSAALTAFTTEKNVTVNFDSDTTGCFINRMLIG